MGGTGIQKGTGIVRGDAASHLKPAWIGGQGRPGRLQVARAQGDHMPAGKVVRLVGCSEPGRRIHALKIGDRP